MTALAHNKTLLVIAMWRQGADTQDIAERARLSEAEVYRITSARPRSEPVSLEIPYAGAPR
jgi:hypothetical protein